MKRLLFIAVGLLLLAGKVAACPGCRDALSANGGLNLTPWDSSQGDMGAAYSYSVLFMLALPFTLLAGFGGAFWWMTRAAAPKKDPLDPQLPPLESGQS